MSENVHPKGLTTRDCSHWIESPVFGPQWCGRIPKGVGRDAKGNLRKFCELHLPEADAVDGAA